MRIERDIIYQFKAWKEAPNRKPILLKGARQIGKTWVMETFGKECFKYYVKFDFDRHPELKSVFQVSKDPQRIIKELTLYCDQPIVAEVCGFTRVATFIDNLKKRFALTPNQYRTRNFV